jgi:hypothetical protein
MLDLGFLNMFQDVTDVRGVLIIFERGHDRVTFFRFRVGHVVKQRGSMKQD